MSGTRIAFGAASLAGLALLGWVGVLITDKVRCNSLEEDYLNSVGTMRQATILKGMALGNTALGAQSDSMVNEELGAIETTLAAIYEDCGDRAGRTAARKGSALLLGR